MGVEWGAGEELKKGVWKWSSSLQYMEKLQQNLFINYRLLNVLRPK